jgi:hypothetical protein
MKQMRLTIIAIAASLCMTAEAAQAVDFSPAELCKATISVEMGRKTKSMKTVTADPPEVSYRRPDGDSFKYRCKIEGDRVVWRTFLADTQEWGRWRENYEAGDAKTTYQVDAGKLNITNDQAHPATFKKSDF